MKRDSTAIPSDIDAVTYSDLFDLEKIQDLQDKFADSFGVASIITEIDGTPITQPSNFCSLCKDIIRKTDKGLLNCKKSDAAIGKYSSDGPTVQRCLSGGLLDAGAGIQVNGKHIANWLIGQVRDEDFSENSMRAYARKIGADEERAVEEFKKVPVMSRERFVRIANAFYVLAEQISTEAYQNFQKAQLLVQVDESNKALTLRNEKLQATEEELRASNEELRVSNEELQVAEEEIGAANEELRASNNELMEISDKLAQSEQRYKSLSNLSTEGIAIHQNGIVIDCNKALCNMMGYSLEDYIGANGVDLLFDGDDKKTVIENIRKESTEPYRVFANHKDGRKIPVQIESRNGQYNNQKARITSFVDLTNEVQRDLILKESREKYKTVADFTYDWEYWMLPDKSLEYVSPSCERITGYAREEFILYPALLSNIILEEDRSVWDAHWENSWSEDSKTETVFFRIKTKSGAIKWIEHVCQPVYNSNGEFYGRRASNRDITETKEAENKLIAQESNQRALIEGFPDIIMRLDNEGRHMFVSSNVEEILGISYDKFLGKTLGELNLPEAISALLDEKVREVFITQKTVECELGIPSSRGEIILNGRFIPESFSAGQVNTVIIIARNVTEYRQAQTQYKLLFAEMLDGFALHEIVCNDKGEPTDYRFLDVNPAFEKMTGLKKIDIVGKRVTEVLPSTEDYWVDRYGKVALTGEPARFESYSQEIAKYFSVTAFSPGQNRFACIFKDVTSRKMAEEALKNSEGRLRKYFDVGLVGMAMLSARHKWIDFNDYFCEMLGYTRLEFSKKSWMILTEEGDWQEEKKHFESIHQGDVDSFAIEKRFLHKNGNVVHAEISVNVMRGDGGDVDYFVVLINNICDRKDAEKKLQQTQIQYRDFLNVTSDHVTYWRTVPDLRIDLPVEEQIAMLGQSVYVDGSLASCKYYGFDKQEDILGKHYVELVNNHTLVKMLTEFVKNNYSINNVAVHEKLPDGGDKYFLQNLYGVVEDGKLVNIWGSAKDITAQKRAEISLQKKNEEYESLNEELMQTNSELMISMEKAEQSDILKTAFLANMSHEIRTPMNGILGFASLLKDPDVSGKDKENFVEMIESSGKRMLSLINDLVDISKIESGHMELDLHNFSVNDLMDELVRFFAPESNAKNIKLIAKKGLPLAESFLNADKGRLSQVFTNFLSNAFKFTVSGKIVFGYTKKDDFLEFYVRDTGIGIPEHMLEMIFERFRQADNSYSRKHEGSGLGLSISKGLVEMHGGRIWATSELDKGSCFYCTFPYKKIEKTDIAWSIKEDPVELDLKAGRRVLVAEDDDVCYVLLRHILQKEGIDVVRAKDGLEAVEIAYNDAFDMILMDIKMPNMNGMEAASIIKKERPNIPIIAQTAFAHTDDREKILDAGCDDCVFKPIDRKVLLDIVFKYIQNDK